jgi:hypothetical protein
MVALLRAVAVPRRPIAALEPVIGGERYARLTAGAARFLDRMAGRTVWNVSSTAVGGGVAEMLQALVGYVRDLDIPVRWMVIGGGYVPGPRCTVPAPRRSASSRTRRGGPGREHPGRADGRYPEHDETGEQVQVACE